MKALIIDHDEISCQFLASRLKIQGHEAVHEADKHKALDLIARQPFDLVFYDPAPLTSARQLILNIRRNAEQTPYICLTGAREGVAAQAIGAGAHDGLAKPFDPQALAHMLENAQRLTDLLRLFSDTKRDFPSAGGVISKSAFNQLFLSALDRADRYGEQSYMLLFEIANPANDLAAYFGAAQLSEHLVLLRRQSDIIGQIAPGSFALILQRPAAENEPQDAVARFADALANKKDLAFADGTRLALRISLLALPSGTCLKFYEIH